MNKTFFKVFLAGAALLSLDACKKNNLVVDQKVVPPSVAKFNVRQATDTTMIYYIKSTNEPFKIPIGLTTVSDKDRTISFSYSSNSAVTGSQYNAPASIVIPAGKAVDSLPISGIYAGYSGSRKDTLNITITGGDVPAAAYYNRVHVVLRKYCDVVAANLVGNYPNSTDIYNGNASSKPNYLGVVSNWVQVTPTSATVVFTNLGATSDNGWGPFGATDGAINPGLSATLDWADPANFKVTIPLQNYFNDGSGNSTITATGTFSSCDNTFTINATVKYAGNGSSYKHTTIFKK
jgi:hypothetical protein